MPCEQLQVGAWWQEQARPGVAAAGSGRSPSSVPEIRKVSLPCQQIVKKMALLVSGGNGG